MSGCSGTVGIVHHWNSTVCPLKRDSGGLWTAKIRLASGSDQYTFVINGGRWEDFLSQHRVINEHGMHNAIRAVGASPQSCASFSLEPKEDDDG